MASLLPVLALGWVLAGTLRRDADAQGLAQARTEATLLAQTAVRPLALDARGDVRMTPAAQRALTTLSRRAIGSGQVLRLRLQDAHARVVFSDDGSGFSRTPDPDAVEATAGAAVLHLTHLNSDANDSGRAGVAAVEAYLPLRGPSSGRVGGLLELYLPYAPIRHDVARGLHRMLTDLVLGLALLYLVLLGLTTSVTRRLRRAAAINAHLAEHDTLTGLPNRDRFQRDLEAALRAAARTGAQLTVAVVDLDRFKQINDTLGHRNGDELLVELSRRLAARVRSGDLLARLGGDEFGLVLHDAADADAALREARACLGSEVDLAGLSVSVEASIGYAVSPADGAAAGMLIQRAEVAMYLAKAQLEAVMRYDPRLDHHDADTLALAGELRQALAAREFIVHLQPQIDLVEGRLRAVEALVRWQHPTRGTLAPGVFLPLVEQTDLIDELTRQVLDQALAGLRDLGPAGEQITLSVNASARSIVRREFADEVIGILAAHGLAPDRLTVEVTETALLTDPARAAGVLSALRRAGVRISLDDFGSGQTSLGYLSALPIHELKIDRGFVSDMLEHPAQAAIVRSITELGHNLGLTVVGEGVEDDATLAALRESGCDLAQGYLIGRPMAARALADWLRRESWLEPLELSGARDTVA